MAFTNNFRIERVYFERLKTLIEVLKSYKDNVAEEPARTIIENSIDVDGAVLLLYRNLGEAWAELADLIQKTQKLLQDLDDKTEAYHDELNERIDEVNNYLMALIRALEARVDAIEADLQQMGRLFTYDLNRVNDEYTLSESGNPVTFESTAELFSHTRPHLVTVRGNVNGETTYFFPREYDLDTTDGLFEWYSFGFVGNEIHEITVTLLPDDSVNVAVETTDFTTILSRIGSLETRMTAAEGDIDNLEQNKQDKLTAGQNITIDANNVISASGGGTNIVGTVTRSGGTDTADFTPQDIADFLSNDISPSVYYSTSRRMYDYLGEDNDSYIFENVSTNNTSLSILKVMKSTGTVIITNDALKYYPGWKLSGSEMFDNVATEHYYPLPETIDSASEIINNRFTKMYPSSFGTWLLKGNKYIANSGTFGQFTITKQTEYLHAVEFEHGGFNYSINNNSLPSGISLSKDIHVFFNYDCQLYIAIPHYDDNIGDYVNEDRVIENIHLPLEFVIETDGLISALWSNQDKTNKKFTKKEIVNISTDTFVFEKIAASYNFIFYGDHGTVIWFEDNNGTILDPTTDADVSTLLSNFIPNIGIKVNSIGTDAVDNNLHA